MFIGTILAREKWRNLIATRETQTLEVFRQCQDDAIQSCVQPCLGLRFDRVLREHLTPIEMKVITVTLQQLGYEIKFENAEISSYTHHRKVSVTTVTLVCNLHFQSFNWDAQGGLNVLSPKEWKDQAEKFAFRYLFGALNSRIQDSTVASALWSFEIAIETIQSSTGVINLDHVEDNEKNTSLRHPLQWLNAITGFEAKLGGGRKIQISNKDDAAREKAELKEKMVLFSSLNESILGLDTFDA